MPPAQVTQGFVEGRRRPGKPPWSGSPFTMSPAIHWPAALGGPPDLAGM